MAEKKPRDQDDFTGTVKPTAADTSGFGIGTGPDVSHGADGEAPVDQAKRGDSTRPKAPERSGNSGER